MFKPNLFLLFLILVISIFTLHVGADEDFNGFVYASCSQPHYDPGSTYELSVDSVLTSLANAAASTTYTSFTSQDPVSFVCGLFQCRSDLPLSFCESCVHDAISRFSTVCPTAAGGAMQLRSCFVRYGNDSFLGKPDYTVLFKNCGAPPNGGYNDAELPGMRDAALGALVVAAGQPASGAYRIGGAGYVQAMSQCVGDLSADECSNCVDIAVAQLKTECNYAAAGQVYLGKCYARFWSINSNSNSNSARTPPIVVPSKKSSGDGTWKTVAIILASLLGGGGTITIAVTCTIKVVHKVKKYRDGGKGKCVHRCGL